MQSFETVECVFFWQLSDLWELTEEGRSFVGVGGPAAGHQSDEGFSVGDVGGQALLPRVRTHPTQHTKHDLHDVGHL